MSQKPKNFQAMPKERTGNQGQEKLSRFEKKDRRKKNNLQVKSRYLSIASQIESQEQKKEQGQAEGQEQEVSPVQKRRQQREERRTQNLLQKERKEVKEVNKEVARKNVPAGAKLGHVAGKW